MVRYSITGLFSVRKLLLSWDSGNDGITKPNLLSFSSLVISHLKASMKDSINTLSY